MLRGAARFARALHSREFRIYVAGNAFNLIGLWMQRIAVGWLTWELTGSATWLGLIAAAELAPTLVIGPIAGVIADRYPRLRLAQLTQLLAAVLAAMLTVLTLVGWINIWWLLSLMLLQGIIFSVWQPIRLALVSSLVAREDLGSAVAINSVAFNSARFIGPACAGALIVAGGVGWVFAVHALSMLVFLLVLMTIRCDESREPIQRQHRFVTAFRAGVAYVIAHPGIGPCLLLMLASCVFVRPVFELLPGFAAAVFGRGAEGLAALAAAPGIGAVMGGMWLGQRGSVSGLTRLTIRYTLALALVLMLFAATTWFWLGLLCLGLAGLTVTIAGAGTQTLIQTSVEDAMRGRVLSLYGMIMRAGPAIGALLMGIASERFGLRAPLFFGCLVTLAIGWWVRRRQGQMILALEKPYSRSTRA